MAIRHQFTPVLTIVTDDDGTNPRFGGFVLADSYSESCRITDESIEELTGTGLNGQSVEQTASDWLDERRTKLNAAIAGELGQHPSEDPVRIDDLVREARDDMLDLADGIDIRSAFNEVCENVVPSDVTTLFGMVVADNRLGWLTAEPGIMSDEHGDIEPAKALEVGIAEEVKSRVRGLLADELELEENKARLATAQSAFDNAGGRGVEIADEIDRLTRKVEIAEALS